MKKILLPLLILLLAVSCAVADGLTGYFVDVGSGDCTILAEGTDVLMIDAGTEEAGSDILNVLTSYWESLNTTDKLNLTIIITHNHKDHTGGLAYIVNQLKGDNPCFRISKFIMHHDLRLDLHIRVTLNMNKAERIEPENRAVYKISDDLKAQIFFGNFDESGNNSSLVTNVQYKNVHILVAADAERPLEDELLGAGRQLPLQADILRVGHHGSDTSTSLNWVKTVNPKDAIISVGLNDGNGNPSGEVLNTLARCRCIVWQTRYDGTIRLFSDGDSYVLKTAGDKSILPYVINKKNNKIHKNPPPADKPGHADQVKNMVNQEYCADVYAFMMQDDPKKPHSMCEICFPESERKAINKEIERRRSAEAGEIKEDPAETPDP